MNLIFQIMFALISINRAVMLGIPIKFHSHHLLNSVQEYL